MKRAATSKKQPVGRGLDWIHVHNITGLATVVNVA